MPMRFDFTAEMDDGQVIKSTSDGRDLRKWEAEYKKTMVGEHLSFTYLAQLAYISMRRNRVLDGKYPTYVLFDEHCVDLDMERIGADEDQALVGNPTPSEATDDSSATSPTD